MAHENSHSETAAALKRLGQYRGILSSKQLKTIKGQIIAGDICGAEKGLRKLLPAHFIEGGTSNEIHRPRRRPAQRTADRQHGPAATNDHPHP